MPIKVTSIMDPAYRALDVQEFIATLEKACALLNVLAQIQAVTADAIMHSKASETWEAQAKLGLYIGQIRYSPDTKILT